MEERDPRAVLGQLIRDRGEDLASLSRLIGRNPAYLHQYLTRGTPRRLAEADRAVLSRYFDVPATWLGAPEPEPRARHVEVPRYDFAASAGPGREGDDRRRPAGVAFADSWLDAAGLAGRVERLSVIEVAGTSMLPTLAPGDEILVDAGDTRACAGIFVLRLDGAIHVKRLVRDGWRLRIVSDNPEAPPLPTDDARDAVLLGRVRWTGRRLD